MTLRLNRHAARGTALLALLALSLGSLSCGSHDPADCTEGGGGPDTAWPQYGNDAGGTRFSPLSDIHGGNVACLKEAWRFRTGDLPDARGEQPSDLASEVTPVLAFGQLLLCTPYNRVLALDPATGEERWSFDPEIDISSRYGNQLVCRGVATWSDPDSEGSAPCARTVFTATNDSRLIGLDAMTGEICPAFGSNGAIDLLEGVGELSWRGEYQITSPPAVGRDVVVVGSAVSDNQRTNAPSGVVRAFDARTGALRWAWDLRPPDFVETPTNTTQAGFALGTPNVWAPMSVDLERNLVFLPTGNPSPDYFRGESTLDYYGSSVVALDLGTGEVAWHFQTVHRDLWDFDVPAQPTLFDLVRDGEKIPALVQATKMGLFFILHRETGEPLFPVVERAVPQSGALGESLAPTQPFPVQPAPLVRHSLSPDEAWGLTPFDRASCRRQLEALHFEGIYTPPTTQGTLMVPGNAGGSNWGGVAVDPVNQRLIANTQDFPWAVALVPRAQMQADASLERDEYAELAPMEGAPYGMRRWRVSSPLGIPCSPPPWGELAAISLETGELEWQVPLGSIRDVAPIPIPTDLGVPNLGGPLVTGGGLVFIGAALEKTFRAFDAGSGEMLWSTRVPYGAQATPMTYRAKGRQFVLIAATGYGRAGMEAGDVILAYALPQTTQR